MEATDPVEAKTATGSRSLGSLAERAKPSFWRRTLRVARQKPLGTVGFLIILIMVVAAAGADLIIRHDLYQLSVTDRLVGPNSEFWFGTDEFGRDLFSRIVWGARISITVGLISVMCGTTVGAVLGAASAFFGGRLDFFMQRIMDALLAFPTLVLALAVVAALGRSLANVIIAISIVLIPTANRVVRSAVLGIKNEQYTEAARAIGCTSLRVLFRHVIPNSMAPYIVLATVALGTAILAEASLSFLGLGTPPPEPSWGGMLSAQGQAYMRQAPWLAIFPGLAITFAVYGFNMLGDALRDIMDPRLRGR